MDTYKGYNGAARVPTRATSLTWPPAWMVDSPPPPEPDPADILRADLDHVIRSTDSDPLRRVLAIYRRMIGRPGTTIEGIRLSVVEAVHNARITSYLESADSAALGECTQ